MPSIQHISSLSEFNSSVKADKLTVVKFTAVWYVEIATSNCDKRDFGILGNLKQTLQDTRSDVGLNAYLYIVLTVIGPCKAVAPRFEALAKKTEGVQFLEVDVDQQKEVAAANGIRAMPTFVFMKNGQKIAEVVGADINKVERLTMQHSSLSSFAGTGHVLGSADKPSTTKTMASTSNGGAATFGMDTNSVILIGILAWSARSEAVAIARRVLEDPISSNVVVITEESVCANGTTFGIRIASYPQNSFTPSWQTPICLNTPLTLISAVSSQTNGTSVLYLSYRSFSQILVQSVALIDGTASATILSAAPIALTPGIVAVYQQHIVLINRTQLLDITANTQQNVSFLAATDKVTWMLAGSSGIYCLGQGAASNATNANMTGIWVTNSLRVADTPEIYRADVNTNVKLLGQASNAPPGPQLPPVIICSNALFISFTPIDGTGLSVLTYNTTTNNISTPMTPVITAADRVISLTCMPITNSVLLILARNASTGLAYAISFDPTFGISSPLALVAPTPVGAPTNLKWNVGAIDVATPGAANGTVAAAVVGSSSSMSAGVGTVFATSYQVSIFEPLLPGNALSPNRSIPCNPSSSASSGDCVASPTPGPGGNTDGGLSAGDKIGIGVAGVAVVAVGLGFMAYMGRKRTFVAEGAEAGAEIDENRDPNRHSDGSDMYKSQLGAAPMLPPLLAIRGDSDIAESTSSLPPLPPLPDHSPPLPPPLRNFAFNKQLSAARGLSNRQTSAATILPTESPHDVARADTLKRGGKAPILSEDVESQILNSYQDTNSQQPTSISETIVSKGWNTVPPITTTRTLGSSSSPNGEKRPLLTPTFGGGESHHSRGSSRSSTGPGVTRIDTQLGTGLETQLETGEDTAVNALSPDEFDFDKLIDEQFAELLDKAPHDRDLSAPFSIQESPIILPEAVIASQRERGLNTRPYNSNHNKNMNTHNMNADNNEDPKQRKSLVSLIQGYDDLTSKRPTQPQPLETLYSSESETSLNSNSSSEPEGSVSEGESEPPSVFGDIVSRSSRARSPTPGPNSSREFMQIRPAPQPIAPSPAVFVEEPIQYSNTSPYRPPMSSFHRSTTNALRLKMDNIATPPVISHPTNNNNHTSSGIVIPPRSSSHNLPKRSQSARQGNFPPLPPIPAKYEAAVAATRSNIPQPTYNAGRAKPLSPVEESPMLENTPISVDEWLASADAVEWSK
ncbi:hypothetical protein SmJEL517_g03394 [Synchytrium microbalum]|uniref:Thioredoxin domain-containing protein n=1 Tax=Synchytrium microbalum TaxID=1806994 RepID=A0A507BYH7_9FUNG|nr:uncharacterized protein SmJEL517_g03394 [Synchytrium microbalum]TPX33857.1 hypothetical protein SmJEL517_g03394 [Synchytrium microbalum]